MPGFATPWLFGVAVAAAAAIAGLHLLSVRTPPPMMLPTSRFVAGGDARAVARQPRLDDVWLLLLRVCAVLAAGAALAGIRWPSSTATELHLVVADATWRSDTAWRDSVVRRFDAPGTMVEMTYASGVRRDAGAALVTALRRATELTGTHPALSRVRLTVVLPDSVTSVAGFAAWRSQWPGAVTVVRRGAAAARGDTVPGDAVPGDSVPGDTARGDFGGGAAPGPAVQVVGAPRGDVVEAAFAQPGPSGGRRVRIIRASSAAGAADDARTVVVRWPVNGLPDGWEAVRPADTVGALVARGDVIVGPFVRTARPGRALRARMAAGDSEHVVAWWGDGEPAVLERVVDRDGRCTRDVAVVTARTGDLLLAAGAAGVREAIVAPCGETVVSTASLVAAADSLRAAPAPAAAFRTGSARTTTSDPWWLAPVLLAFALMLLIGEWWWRDRGGSA